MTDPLSLTARRISVIAPHPDDESLGCGGLIAAFVADRRTVQTIFVTDGAGSHPKSITWPANRLAAQRAKEAAEALERLGAGAQPRTFLGLPDTRAPKPEDPGGEAAVAALAHVVEAFSPELVLAPWRRDPHRDHRTAWSLAMAALDLAGLTPDVLEYGIWLVETGTPADHPRPGEVQKVTFDIARFVLCKRRAVEAHLSQVTDLISDDPKGFQLSEATIDRLVGPTESYWQSCT